jgi:hypothetical protein
LEFRLSCTEIIDWLKNGIEIIFKSSKSSVFQGWARSNVSCHLYSFCFKNRESLPFLISVIDPILISVSFLLYWILDLQHSALIHSRGHRATLIELINQKEVVGDLFNQLRLALQRRNTGRPAQVSMIPCLKYCSHTFLSMFQSICAPYSFLYL